MNMRPMKIFNDPNDNQKSAVEGLLKNLVLRYPVLIECEESIREAYFLLRNCFFAGNKLLVAGNGGSAADAEHIVGELMKSFRKKRPISPTLASSLLSIDSEKGRLLSEKLEAPLPAIALVSHSALTTAYCNDVDPRYVYAQQLLGFGKPGDVFLGISTSGNSENVINAAVLAKAYGLSVLALTGKSGGALSAISDMAIRVPEIETYKIQELHLPIYHCICLMLEEHFFGGNI